MRLILPATAVCLLAFYSIVAFLALQPRVSEAYRDYYIKGKAGLSLREREDLPAIRSGLDYRHTTGKLGFVGWAPPENDYRWSLGHEVKLVFRVAGPETRPGSMRLTLSSLGAQRVHWSMNAQPGGAATLDGRAPAAIDIPTRAAHPGLNVLRLHLPDAHRPGNGDTRVLAIALHKIRFLPEPTSAP